LWSGRCLLHAGFIKNKSGLGGSRLVSTLCRFFSLKSLSDQSALARRCHQHYESLHNL
jgi:hypothetical protein